MLPKPMMYSGPSFVFEPVLKDPPWIKRITGMLSPGFEFCMKCQKILIAWTLSNNKKKTNDRILSFPTVPDFGKMCSVANHGKRPLPKNKYFIFWRIRTRGGGIMIYLSREIIGCGTKISNFLLFFLTAKSDWRKMDGNLQVSNSTLFEGGKFPHFKGRLERFP